MGMSKNISNFLNSIPDKRIARAIQSVIDQTQPIGKDTAITALAGGAQAGTQLKQNCAYHDVTTVASAGDSVALPDAVVGEVHFVKNSAALSMQVFAPTPGTIDSVATGTGVAQLAGDGVLYVCVVQGNYIRFGGLSATEIFGAVVVNSIAGGDSSLGIDGQAAAQGGAVVVTGGTSSTTGNAGGAASQVGGTPGATGIGGASTVRGGAGGSTSGKGGAANVTGGAGTAGNGSGGSVILAGGAKHGSGLDGGVFNRGTFQMRSQAAPQTATDTATLTAAQLLGGIISATPTAAANYTLPTGTDLKAALPTDLAAGDSFDVYVINLGGSGDDITILVGADITIVGNPVITVAVPSQALLRFRFVSGTTFVMYRIG